ncbi:MFS transporter [Occallatibacter savannae]|uniref:MFS transporter n=1 Tax=Occallatibacter savannae TaxID=1002691 RepID=UPI000D68A8F3|nr:MFS transporter [Occallatibacter savannae]
MTTALTAYTDQTRRRYNLILQVVAGLGGLLYGIDVGIIGGALPYLEATSKLDPSQLSIIVAAVLLGSVLSTLFAGLLADWMGRKPLMILSGAAFILSIPVIALSQGYSSLFFGRLLQGMSGGLIGIVVPLYLAECLSASTRGKGTGVFQWMLTFGIVVAALIGIFFSYRVEAVARLGDAAALFDFKNHAWRSIFWMSMPPGILFVLGAFLVTESPRWLYRRSPERARAALLRSRAPEQATIELREMEAASKPAIATAGVKASDSLLRRKYVIPFLLACIILACNTATGINSIIGFNTNILIQSGLSDLQSHWGYVILTACNFCFTAIGMTLVDRKGRKFLFILGTSGIILAMLIVGTLFRQTEKENIDCRDQIQALVSANPGAQQLTYQFNKDKAQQLLAAAGATSAAIDPSRASFAIIYSYGDFTGTTSYARSDDPAAPPLIVTRASAVPANKVQALFQNPFGNYEAARTAPLRIDKAVLGPVPQQSHGWLVAIFIYMFIAFYATGPGVCVWLALSELMPTRIRSNGMSIALVINQLVSAILQAIFLPFVAKHSYSSMFYLFASFTVVYFLTTTFLFPETKGKTLEEIEAFFEKTATD